MLKVKDSFHFKAGITVVIFVLACLPFIPRPAPRSAGLLTQEAYVWQRAWNGSVADSIASYSSNFTTIIPLAAEVVWNGEKATIARVRIDLELLRKNARGIGLALRVGTFAGPFQTHGEAIESVTELAASLVSNAIAQNVRVSELHMDFDCADSRLDGYRLWIETIKTRLNPVPVIITALPSWLNESAFKRLATAADGYILQVHSLERPTHNSSSLAIFDPEKADGWVEQAARLGFPFRVALPTYGYLAAFTPDGTFLGASAEGPQPIWPKESMIQEICSNAGQIANLMLEWKNSRPAALTGVIWYRLPVATDSLNWSWPTLAAVMEGRIPNRHWKPSARWREQRLVEVLLTNNGETDLSVWPSVRVRRNVGRLVAGDGLNGYQLTEPEPGTVEFLPRPSARPARFRAGEEIVIGWMRLDADEVELQFEVP